MKEYGSSYEMKNLEFKDMTGSLNEKELLELKEFDYQLAKGEGNDVKKIQELIDEPCEEENLDLIL